MVFTFPDHWISPTQWFGYLAFVLGVASFLQKNDRRFKWLMAGECLAYVAHFLLLGVPTAAASASVSVVRSVLSLYTRSVWVALAVVAVNLALGYGLATQWWNWLPLVASCIGTLALFLLKGIRMRVAMLAGTVLWITNNALAGSIGGTALEVVILLVNSYTIARMFKASRPRPPPAAATAQSPQSPHP
ncbi:YgjV family protein [Rhodoferax sp. AJA081-3]|uniref:YgjV family protein n=1 Tax=Rhodoferax sp. AJA081-3 TaxID=2752316 RepID=UPI001AE0C275|nr:YgjV family protein [Rhodoferax sp. AJA081-3]QTN26332.1 YgjV family protein [Rhodoferax sp. AJA081-3]